MSVRSFLGFAAASLIFVACSDSPTSPSTSVPDVASLLAEMSLSGIGAATSIASLSVGASISSTPAMDPGNCAYSSASGYFVCPTLTANGLTFTRMYKLIDDAGNGQSRPDVHTSAIETKTSVEGTLTSTVSGPTPSTSTLTVDANSTDTLSAIRAANHILSGVSTNSLSGSAQFGSITVPINETDKETTTELVLPNARAGQRWPLSGSIALETTSNEGSGVIAQTARVVITFNGTSVVTMTITTSTGTTTCHFDLAAPPGTGGVGACS